MPHGEEPNSAFGTNRCAMLDGVLDGLRGGSWRKFPSSSQDRLLRWCAVQRFVVGVGAGRSLASEALQAFFHQDSADHFLEDVGMTDENFTGLRDHITSS